MNHKFLMLSSMWDNSYIMEIIRGMRERLQNEKYIIHIFNAYDISDWEGSKEKEQEIYSLPKFEEYDGVFLTTNAIGNLDAIDSKLDYIRSLNIPIVSMGIEFKNTIYVGVDDYRAVYSMVEHMIVKHNCQVFNFVGGPKDDAGSLLRYRGFCDCLKDYGITIDSERVIFLHYLYSDGYEAYNYYKDRNLHMPDAVICANDSMALGYCDIAGEDGYYAPTDYRITGYDDYQPARDYIPSISSVSNNWENMGYVGVDMILKKLDGYCVPDKQNSSEIITFNQSCGCDELNKDYRGDSLIKLKRARLESQVAVGHRYILQMLCSCGDIDQVQQKLSEIMKVVRLEHIALCINESIIKADIDSVTNGYDENIHIFTDEETEVIDRRFSLIPSSWKDKKGMDVLMFAPLYFDKNTFGYVLVPYGETLVSYTKQRTFYENLSIALEAIRQRSELNHMNQKLQNLYVHDSLTGLYNRFGFSQLSTDYFNECNGLIYVTYLDVNCLKQINDKYGHEIGDLAIKGVANAIKNIFPHNDICVRMGGDEFLVIGRMGKGPDFASLRPVLTKYLTEYSTNEDLPFVLSASVGIVENSADERLSLDDMVHAADKRMYDDKQRIKGEGYSV